LVYNGSQKIKVKLKPNYYILHLKNCYKKIKKVKIKYEYIYASNNFKKNTKHNPQIKISSSEIFLKFIESLSNRNSKILFRLHPSEKINDYKFIKKNFKNVTFDNNSNILKSLVLSKTLVGCETMAIVVAKKLGLKTINLDIGIKNIKSIPKKFIDKTIKIN